MTSSTSPSQSSLSIRQFREEVARLRTLTKAVGLSLADRIGLVPAKTLNVPALTVARVWRRVAETSGVEIGLVR